ncbi:MAG: hypothetical protein ACXW5U_30705 [Thermoanaerobaculia bacterium]
MRLIGILLFIATFARGAEVTRAGRWELHSSFWMNLHQTLMHDASTRTPRDLSALPKEHQESWTAAVSAYREAWGGKGSITFAQTMMNAQDDLGQIADDAVNPPLAGPLTAAMRGAAPVYRAHWWPADDTANRFVIGYAAAMLRDAGEELARAHEQAYRTEFPRSIRVDLTAYAVPFGAYTHDLPHAGPVVTMSSRDAGNQGHRALETILHESSHTLVYPRYGTVASAIAASSKRLGIDPPRDLWHAILFATTSELTRRALLKRGVTDFTPSSVDLLTRAWPQYREPIETHWMPYLSGKGTLEEAIDRVVAAVPR